MKSPMYAMCSHQQSDLLDSGLLGQCVKAGGVSTLVGVVLAHSFIDVLKRFRGLGLLLFLLDLGAVCRDRFDQLLLFLTGVLQDDDPARVQLRGKKTSVLKIERDSHINLQGIQTQEYFEKCICNCHDSGTHVNCQTTVGKKRYNKILRVHLNSCNSSVAWPPTAVSVFRRNFALKFKTAHCLTSFPRTAGLAYQAQSVRPFYHFHFHHGS